MMKHLFLFIPLLFITACEKEAIRPVAEPPQDGLLAYYTFDGNANDSGAFGIDGTSMGAKLAADKYDLDHCYEFNGQSDYIELPAHKQFNFKGDFSIAAWIYPLKEDRAYVIHKGQSGRGGGSFSLDIYPGRVRLIINTDDIEKSLILRGQSRIQSREWQHIAAVKQGSTYRIFYNGKEEGRTEFSEPMQITNNVVTIGAYLWAFPNALFEGKIDNVLFYKLALSNEEVSQLFDNYN